MRFRLQTCLFATTLFALGFGWWFDRSNRDNELAQALSAQQFVDDIVYRVRYADEPSLDQQSKLAGPNRLLVVAVVEIFEQNSRIKKLNEVRGTGYSAYKLADSVLTKLGTESADDYFKALASFKVTRGKFAEYTNPESAAHLALRDFVVKSLPKPIQFSQILTKRGVRTGRIMITPLPQIQDSQLVVPLE